MSHLGSEESSWVNSIRKEMLLNLVNCFLMSHLGSEESSWLNSIRKEMLSHLGSGGTSWVKSNLCKRLHSSHAQKALVSLRKEMLLNLVNCF